MKTIGYLVLILLGISTTETAFSQHTPKIQWQRCLGGDSTDAARCIIQTRDGGYAIAGTTVSTNGDVTSALGGFDEWVVKLRANGSIEWQVSLGGSGNDTTFSMIQTANGNYIIVGRTNSIDGEAIGNHGSDDALIIKLDANGKVISHKCFGGSDVDQLYSIINTFDGGYAIAGMSFSSDGDLTVRNGKGHAWIMKFTSKDSLQWVSSPGGSGDDIANAIIQTSDSGYAIAGYTSSSDGDATGHHSYGAFYGYDAWVVKLNSNGNVLWHKCLGGSDDDQANALVQTSDGGFAIAAQTISADGDVIGRHVGADSGNGDGWFIRLDSAGNILSQKCLGGNDDDYFSSIIQTSDGGFILAGSTRSDDGDVFGFYGGTGYDAWLVKLNAASNIEWQKCYGGTNGDHALSLISTSDGGYAFSGYSYSINGDVIGNHGGVFSPDAWVVKLMPSSGVQNNIDQYAGLHLSSYPNPSSNQITIGFDLQNASKPLISITDINGSIMQEFQVPLSDQGYHERQIDMSAISSGTYFINVEAEGISETRKILLVR